MKKNKTFFSSLAYDWYKYLLAFLPMVTVLIVSTLNTKITFKEEIRIFNYIDPDTDSFLKELTSEFSDQGILNSLIQPYTIEISQFDDYLEVSGYEYSDIVILPESKIFEDVNYYSAKSYHFGNNENDEYYKLIKDKNSDVKLFNYNETQFGYYAVKIFEKDNNEYNSKIKFNDYYSFKEDSVAFISKKSNKLENKIAINALLYLI